MTIIRTYQELIQIPTFMGRYEYLKLDGKVGIETFGYDRIFNQMLYTSNEWKDIRKFVIARDMGCDLGMPGHDIPTGVRIIVHHMNPITLYDIEHSTDILLDPNYLITTIHNTHQAVHYGDKELLVVEPIIRTPNDTCPWKRK